jgi:hypothetical protein
MSQTDVCRAEVCSWEGYGLEGLDLYIIWSECTQSDWSSGNSRESMSINYAATEFDSNQFSKHWRNVTEAKGTALVW